MTRSTNGFCQGALGAVSTLACPPRNSPWEHLTVDRVAIPEQVGRSRVLRERLDDLLGRPDGRSMIGDVEMEEFAPVMPKGDEDEEEMEGEGGDDEEVDGGHVAEVSRQKSAPRRGGPA
jgi:hypothetical protein